MLATSLNQVKIVSMIILRGDLDVNLYSGRLSITALHYVAKKGYVNIFRLILGHPNIKINGPGYAGPPLLRAVLNSHVFVIEVLLNYR